MLEAQNALTEAVAAVPAEPSVNAEEIEALTAELAASKEECDTPLEKLAFAHESEVNATEQITTLTTRLEEP